MADPLDTATVIPVTADARWFEDLADDWPDKPVARHFRAVVHRKDIERASQAPVINVTVPGIPGHFTAVAGTDEVAYSTGPAPEADGSLTVVQGS